MSKILIVEDEGLVGLELTYLLEDLGHEVVGVAADVQECESLAHPAPDMALVDLNLADGATGLELGRRLACEQGVSVVYTTANPAMLGDGVEGAVGVLPKPYNPDSMEAAVNYALSVRRGCRPSVPRRMRVFPTGEQRAFG